MTKDPGELARELAAIQNRLREELIEELQGQGNDLGTICDIHSYSPLVQELREKYLTRLFLLQGIIQQLAHYSRGSNKRTTRVLSLAAQDRKELVRLVNRKLKKLNGVKVLDVKFVAEDEEGWAALITYQLNPFVPGPGETIARM